MQLNNKLVIKYIEKKVLEKKLNKKHKLKTK